VQSLHCYRGPESRQNINPWFGTIMNGYQEEENFSREFEELIAKSSEKNE
jgi:hypothetical protein